MTRKQGSKDARSILKNTSVNFVSMLLTQLAALVSAIYLGRTLGPATIAIYAYSFSVVTIVLRLANFGTDQVLTRESACEPKDSGRLLMSSLALRIPASVVIYIVLLLLLHFNVLQFRYGLPTEGRFLMYIVWLTLFTESAIQAMKAVFAGLERQEISSVVLTASAVLRVALTIMVVALGFGLFHMGLVVLLVSIAGVALLGRSLSRLTTINFNIGPGAVRDMAIVGSSFVVMEIFLGVISKFDVVYLPSVVPLRELGLYAYAYRPLDVMLAAGLAADMALFPIIARRCQDGPDSLKGVWDAAHKYLAMTVVPIAIITSLMAEEIMLLMFGNEFAGSGRVLSVLVWSGVVYFPMIPSYRILISRNGQKRLLPVFAVKAAANIVLNLILVPLYGIMGSALAMVITEFLHATLCFLFPFRSVEIFPIARWYLKPALAAAPMAVLMLQMRGDYHLFAVVFAAILVYLTALVITKGLTIQDLKVFQDALASRNDPVQDEQAKETLE